MGTVRSGAAHPTKLTLDLEQLFSTYSRNYLFYNIFSRRGAETQRKTYLSFSAPLRLCARSAVNEI